MARSQARKPRSSRRFRRPRPFSGRLEWLERRELLTGSPLVYVAPTTGSHAIELVPAGDSLEIVDNAVVVASEPTSLVTSVSITGAAQGVNDYNLHLDIPYSGSITIDDPSMAGIMEVHTSSTAAVSLSAGAIAQGGVSVVYTGLTNVLDQFSGGPTAVSVLGTASGTATTLDLGLFASQVVLGDPSSGTSNPLGNIQGALNLENSGQSSLTVDASAATTALSVMVSATSMTGPSLPGGVGFGRLASLAVDLGSGNDVLGLEGLPAPSISLNGGAGSDTLAINLLGNLAQGLSPQGFETISMRVGGDFSSAVSAPATSRFSSVEVDGAWTSTGVIQGGSFSSVLALHDVSGTLKAIKDPAVSGSGVIQNLRIQGSLTNTGQITGSVLSDLVVQNDVSGDIRAVEDPIDPDNLTGKIVNLSLGSVSGLGSIEAGTFNGLTISGALAGKITAIESTTSPGNGSGAFVGASIGSVSDTGSISAGSISTVNITGDMAGTITAQGASTIDGVSITGSLSGSIGANYDTGTSTLGQVSNVSVGGVSSTGSISGNSVTGVTVTGSMDGSIDGSNGGTVSGVTIGTLTGTVSATMSGNPDGGSVSGINVTGDMSGSIIGGTVNGVTVGGSMTGGSMTGGSISSVTIDGDMAGTITAQGASTIDGVSITGTMSGSIGANYDAGTSTPGQISGVTVGGLTGTVSATMTGNLDGGSVSGINVTSDMSGSMSGGSVSGVTVGGSMTGGSMTGGSISSVTIDGDMAGTITAKGSGTIGDLFILGNLTGDVNAQKDQTDGSGSLDKLTVKGDISGTVLAPTSLVVGSLNTVSKNGYIKVGDVNTFTLTSCAGTMIIGSVKNLTATGSLGDGMTLGTIAAGTTLSAGSFGSLTIPGDLAGQLKVAGTLGSLTVGGKAPGSISANHIGTIEVQNGTGPIVLQVTENGIQRRIETSSLAPSSSVHFQVLYESGVLANPQATIQVSHGSASGPDSYDLSLVTYNDTAKFNLARLDSEGASGIANVDVEGDVLSSVSGLALSFFSEDHTPAGIHLPQDDLIGIGVRDYVPSGGVLQAHSIEGLAVGSLPGKTGQAASAFDVQNLLSSDTQLALANGTFRVPFADLSSQQSALFFVSDPRARSFDNNPVDLSVQSVVSANADGTQNVVHQSNQSRGAAVALIRIAPTFNRHGKVVDSEITGITIEGDGASITTRQSINGPIVSSGSLGDLNLEGAGDIGDISAASIFGTISPGSEVTGTIQTTTGDFGRVYLDSHNHLTVTSLTLGNEFQGSLLVAGNLISQITLNGGLGNASEIKAGGTLGAQVGSTRLGGLLIDGGDSGAIDIGGTVLGDITINGGISGDLIALGDISGNVVVNGGVRSGGSIASGGSILGNLTINGGLAWNSSVVAQGTIGNQATGTRFLLNGNNRGIIAASCAIQFAQPVSGSVFNNAAVNDPSSAAVIDQIFDTTNPGDFSEIVAHLAALKVKNGKLSLG